MSTIAYYFLQVVLCSGLMMGYYLLVLRNKRFHQYNRFYLLTVAILSWIVPLIKIRWSHPPVTDTAQMLQLLSVVADSNSKLEDNISQGFQWSGYAIGAILYVLVAVILLTTMVMALYKVYRLLKHHSCKNVEDVYLILTHEKGTPFSFFRYIFWNEEIDLRSESGKQILQHEIAHVQQKHSVDKIFIQVMLVPGWFNPFFWLLKKELEMIHEFIADKRAVNDGDTASLAQMLLTAAFPQQKFAMTNPFFFSPIRRRLQMLTNTANPRFSYLRRTIVLPLLAVVVVLFSFRSKEKRETLTLSVASVVEDVISAVKNDNTAKHPPVEVRVSNLAYLDRTYTVVIDAGHGGNDKGTLAADGTAESELMLQLAQKIKELNSNPSINIVLTRDADIHQTTKQIISLVNDLNPDLYISLHTNSAVGNLKTANAQKNISGIDFFIPGSQAEANYTGSHLLASAIAKSVERLKQPMGGIRTRPGAQLIIDQVKTPGVMIEAGFITNAEDVKKLKDDNYQLRLANLILNGVNDFLADSRKNKDVVKVVAADEKTAPILSDVVIHKRDTTVPASVTFKTLNIIVKDKDGNITKSFPADFSLNPVAKDTPRIKKALIVLDGVKMEGWWKLDSLDMGTIASVEVIKDENAYRMYGEEARNGVVIITTKKGGEYKNLKLMPVKVEGREIVVQGYKIGEQAEFPGGQPGWIIYLGRNLRLDKIQANGAPPGKYTVIVSFAVSENGDISDISALNDPGYGTKEEAIRMIEKGPKWKAAEKEGRNINSVRRQSITFVVPDNKATTSL